MARMGVETFELACRVLDLDSSGCGTETWFGKRVRTRA